jgi:hypothetical protein
MARRSNSSQCKISCASESSVRSLTSLQCQTVWALDHEKGQKTDLCSNKQQIGFWPVKVNIRCKKGSLQGFCSKPSISRGAILRKNKRQKTTPSLAWSVFPLWFLQKNRVFLTLFFKNMQKMTGFWAFWCKKCFRYPLNSTATPPTAKPGGSKKGSE